MVVTWNSGERVLRCLRALADEQPPERTFVVDNASSDGTVEGVRVRFPGVHVLQLDHNGGFGAAVNAGSRLGSAEALVLVNDDVIVDAGCVSALLEPLQADARCGMVAGMTLMPESGAVDGFGIELDPTLAAYNRLRGMEPSAQPGSLAMPSGGLAAYRREAFERCGGFDERLFAYGEDVDLGLRMRLAGWSAAQAPEASGVHEGGASVGVNSPRQRELAGFARGFLLRRYGVLRSRAWARALLFEALVVGWGLAAHRTTIPLRSRMRGWRAAGRGHLPLPAGVVDDSISASRAFGRLRGAR